MLEDAKGRKWNVKINYRTVMRLKEELDVDLLELSEDKTTMTAATRLLEDPGLLCGVLANLLQDQMKEDGITEDQFAEGMLGNAIDLGYYEVMDGVANFSPNPIRDLLKQQIERHKKVAVQLVERQGKAMESQRMDKAIDSALDSLESSFWKSAELLASKIQETIPGEK